MAFPMSTFFDIEKLGGYNGFKIHAANFDGNKQPLDVFLRDKEEWRDWNRYRALGAKDDFNRHYIFSMMHFYPTDNRSIWLFGGVFEVKDRDPSVDYHSYNSVLTNLGEELIGRLKIELYIGSRGKSFLPETWWEKMSVYELLADPYSGEVFPGYDNISLDFTMLETIIRNQPTDWKTALQHIKGIYCIADKESGRKYIGSAYNEMGIWSRWEEYIHTGHGWDQKLVKLIAEKGMEYARKNFRFTLLEIHSSKIGDKFIIGRESFWKDALLTRGEHGYNAN